MVPSTEGSLEIKWLPHWLNGHDSTTLFTSQSCSEDQVMYMNTYLLYINLEVFMVYFAEEKMSFGVRG